MTYQVKLTNNAVGQLKEAIEHIAKGLCEPETARRWSARIQKEMVSLDHMPFRHPLVAEEPWHTEGIRKMTVEHFIVYYWVNKETTTVWITAVVYGRRDQLAVLRHMPKE